jgi:iron complex transport system substrate-binding protein
LWPIDQAVPTHFASTILQGRLNMRIVSLIPSATEIVDCLGLTSYLVGRSHECDFPESVRSLPICTAPKFDPHGDSATIHDRVTDILQSALSVYNIDTELLQKLQPTHILTQAQCEVCAVNLSDVEQAVASLTGCTPQIISLQPDRLDDVWQDIARSAVAFGVDAEPIISGLKARMTANVATNRPRVACIEWIEPLMAAGNWVPELVALAGGENLFGAVGQHSPWMQWAELVAADPDVIVIMPCGFDLERTRSESVILVQHPDWAGLKAVRSGRVYVTDGNQYFNRPGPRLVESFEILQEIFADREGVHYDRGWSRFAS